MSIHGVLGETTSYPKTYDASVLFAITRTLGRDEIYQATSVASDDLTVGVDVWQAFELSWLDEFGISQVAVARLIIPADSPNIVESKSLKLYLNSLNFTRFATVSAVQVVIERDVSACIGAMVQVQIEPLNTTAFDLVAPLGECIDDVLSRAGVAVELSDDIDSTLLQPKAGQMMQYQFHSHLLRSNCPVTNQPDWGTLSVAISTDKVVDYQQVLAYILTFRQHNGFHEQCVERIFADFLRLFTPTSLMVQANYTRRGGIDINPVRVKNHPVPKIGRQIRQ